MCVSQYYSYMYMYLPCRCTVQFITDYDVISKKPINTCDINAILIALRRLSLQGRL